MTAMQGAITCRIEAPDSARFALLSGDFNPLHVDAQAARRLQFGGTVCHGIHVLLNGLERMAAQGALDLSRVLSLQAVFQAPVLTGQAVDLVWQTDDAGLRLIGRRDGRTLFTLTLGWGDTLPCPPVDVREQTHEAGAPEPRRFESVVTDGDAPTAGWLPTALPADAADLFPTLHRQAPHGHIVAELLVSTRLVGMVLPGLHSVYCGLKLTRRTVADRADGLAWKAVKADARFRTVRLQVTGCAWQGTLETMFRHPPVQQMSLAEVRRQAANGRYAGLRVVVVGGSRGLGELAVKLLLAGGADVTLTYARGRADAHALVAEATLARLPCRALALDVSVPLSADTTGLLAAGEPDALLYFATPLIARNPLPQWSVELFDRYRRFYVDGLVELAQALVAARGPRAAALRVLNPSSVFAVDPPKGFAEYAAAKAAAEVAATHLAQTGRCVVHSPRLPRLRTDQNSDTADPAVADPFPVLDATLQALLAPAQP